MKVRNHKDPLYYDADANEKIFVPSIMVTRSSLTRLQEEDLTEEQRKILQSFPDQDRGIFNPDDLPKQIPGLQMLEDPLEAAAMKAKLKQKKMRQAHKAREMEKRSGYISKSVQFKADAEEEFDEEYYDSDEMAYDSEEEAEAEKLHQEEKQKYFMNGKLAGVV